MPHFRQFILVLPLCFAVASSSWAQQNASLSSQQSSRRGAPEATQNRTTKLAETASAIANEKSRSTPQPKSAIQTQVPQPANPSQRPDQANVQIVRKLPTKHVVDQQVSELSKQRSSRRTRAQVSNSKAWPAKAATKATDRPSQPVARIADARSTAPSENKPSPLKPTLPNGILKPQPSKPSSSVAKLVPNPAPPITTISNVIRSASSASTNLSDKGASVNLSSATGTPPITKLAKQPKPIAPVVPKSLTEVPTANSTAQVEGGPPPTARVAKLPALPKAANGTALRLGALSGAQFKNPSKFLSGKDFRFAKSDQFLKSTPKQPSDTIPSKSQSTQDSVHLPSANMANRVPIRRARTRIQPSNKVLNFSQMDEDESRLLQVKKVDAPIEAVPFAEIQQKGNAKLLGSGTREVPIVDASTFGTLTGQPDRQHFAVYRAHNFKHRPLYFQEINLERYGNELPLQPLVSAAHFFTSAALLPYQMGAKPPTCCQSTLGYERPGDCVPYRIHLLPKSRRGLIYQGLAVTAMSL